MQFSLPEIRPKEWIHRIKEEFFPPRILDKYVFSEFVKIFIGALITLGFLALMSSYSDIKGDMASSKGGKIHGWLFILFRLPQMLIQYIMNIAILFSVSFTVGQFSANKELVAMMAAGISFRRIVAPIVAFSCVLWFAAFFLKQTVVAPLNARANEEHKMLKEGDLNTLVGVVYQKHFKGQEGFYYIYYYDTKEEEIKGGFNYICLTKEQTPDYLLVAQKAKFDFQKEVWILKGVEETKFDDELQVVSVQKFTEKEYTLPEKPDYFKKLKGSVEEMNFFELSEEKENRIRKGLSYGDVDIAKHTLFAEPLLIVVLTLVGCASGFFTKRMAIVSSLGVSIGVALLYMIMDPSFKSLGENEVIPIWLASWITPLLFLSGLYVIYKRLKV
ncbi:LptF/LptG family permease [Leptospira andrefontaineae]|uniref:YjgP/YjgQ family permease n=1 Tax=Leptospira andrefontaineae TaxID=2484976 RepID=A0A4R9H088_9LEPT|nr:LptF/LptG family permease [Leptospira andrefontaineae]TGK37694.1 YjgP/YjgQ family permease [Leptospira andrefontaineae]